MSNRSNIAFEWNEGNFYYWYLCRERTIGNNSDSCEILAYHYLCDMFTLCRISIKPMIKGTTDNCWWHDLRIPDLTLRTRKTGLAPSFGKRFHFSHVFNFYSATYLDYITNAAFHDIILGFEYVTQIGM